jgi:hypothetical protein
VHVRDTTTGVPLLATREELDFFHQDRCLVPADTTAFQAYCRMTDDNSLVLRIAFWLRDRFSVLAGVRPIQGFAGRRSNQAPAAGDKLDFFDVQSICDDELCLMACDRHLSALVALTLAHAVDTKRELIVTTSVCTHNFFGMLYMLPVAPAHGVIVRRMLQRMACRF